MAEFVKVIEEKQRMCKTLMCNNCPLGEPILSCTNWILAQPLEAEKIIMKWEAENPIETNGMKFNEVFGFDLDALYGISEAAIKWFNEEYKGGQE